MHVIVAEGLHDAEYVAAHTEGFERLAAELAAWTPERTQEVTGVPAEEVVALARAYATTRPRPSAGSSASSTIARAARMIRTIACLPALVGAWRDRGGGFIGPTVVGRQRSARRRRALTGPEADDRARSTWSGSGTR